MLTQPNNAHLHRIPLPHPPPTSNPISSQTHHLCLMFYPCKHNPTKTQPNFLRLLEGRGETQECTQSTTQNHLTLVKPSLSYLSTDPFTTPFSASCPTLSRRKQSSTKDASPTTNCQKFAGGRATFSSQTTQKRRNPRIFSFSSHNKSHNRLHSSFSTKFWFFHSFLYTPFFLSLPSHSGKFLQQTKHLSHFHFFLSFFETFYNFNLTVF